MNKRTYYYRNTYIFVSGFYEWDQSPMQLPKRNPSRFDSLSQSDRQGAQAEEGMQANPCLGQGSRQWLRTKI